MTGLNDLDAELQVLDDFLMSDGAPEGCLPISAIDGFLTAIAIGPEMVLPSEWLPVIWGNEEPVFDDNAQAQACIGALMHLYNQIPHQIDSRQIAPILVETPDGEIIAEEWAAGFARGIAMHPEAWDPLLASEADWVMLMTILALCPMPDGELSAELPPEFIDSCIDNAEDLIPEAVLGIADYWRETRITAMRQATVRRTTPKIGRNDPCPCGSGKKFKKCCGAG